MQITKEMGRNIAKLAFGLVLAMSIAITISPAAAHAQFADDGGCCGGYSYDYSYPMDYGSSYDYSYPMDYGSSYDYSYPMDYGSSYDYSYPMDYGSSYDYSYPMDYGSSYDYSYPMDYGYSYDYSYPMDYGYGSYGNTAAPIYSYGTPSYGGIGGFGGYGGYGGYGGGYYVEPIPTWPTMPRYTATPSYSNTYIDRTTAPTWPSTTQVTASASAVGTATGGNANQEQQQNQTNNQEQANSQILSTTHTQTQNNPVTVTQNQAPINNSNTNINNITIPAPVYQAPNQFSINYNFAQEYQVPTCTISVSNSYYNSYSNQPVTLTWSSTKAFSASISPNVGTVNPNGSTTVYPTGGTTIYTLTVHGQGGSNTCQTQVIYQAQPPVYQPPVYQPPVYVPPQVTPPPYVALTQIPYTGFDFGPVGNSIYWAGLLSFALAAAYLVIYYKGGLAFAMGTTGRRSTPRTHAAAKETAKTMASAEAPVAKTPTSMFANLPTREYRNATADAMAIIQPKSSDEMPRITITRA